MTNSLTLLLSPVTHELILIPGYHKSTQLFHKYLSIQLFTHITYLNDFWLGPNTLVSYQRVLVSSWFSYLVPRFDFLVHVEHLDSTLTTTQVQEEFSHYLLFGTLDVWLSPVLHSCVEISKTADYIPHIFFNLLTNIVLIFYNILCVH